MNSPINSEDQERVLGVLHSRGWVSSEDLMVVLGKSQPTVSRVLASLGGQVLAFGNARARRYGLPKPIRGRPARQPVWWTDEQGRTHELAMLTFLAAGMVYIESESIQSAAPAANSRSLWQPSIAAGTCW